MTWKDNKKFASVLGQQMAYVELGEGHPIIFQHGNPVSSYLWRNIMEPLSDTARCIAPDLIGMGDSAKLPVSGPDSYTFQQHYQYFEALLDQLVPQVPVTLVIHDWGSALGFHWANMHRDRVAGIAYMEGIVHPYSWATFSQAARPVFEGFRSPAGEAMVLDKNIFIEKVLPGSILRELSSEEMDEYRRPFANPGEDRRPTLTWPRQIPIDGEPADVTSIVKDYGNWLAGSDIPKLFINAEPGAITTGPVRDFCRTWPNQTEVTVKGIHFIQEDSPEGITTAIRNWLPQLE